LRDVAGMMRSFHYAAFSSLFGRPDGRLSMSDDVAFFEAWAHHWYAWSSSAFLKSYLQSAAQADVVPSAREDLEILLRAYLIDKAIYELGYELNNRPDWVRIPLEGILQLVGD
jgi:maltose alpha-D-glucosyltransferase / alpha-amylase